MSELYKAIAGSPITYLAGDISAGQTTIAVADDTALPDAPNICTIGYGEHIETIRYGAKSNGVLQDVTRGIEGTPRAWQSGTEVARFYTAYDHNAIINTLTSHLAESVTKADLTQTAEVNDSTKVPSSAVTYKLNNDIGLKFYGPSAWNDLTDANDVTNTIAYVSRSNCSNLPSGLIANGVLITIRHSNAPNGHGIQFFIEVADARANRIYFRQCVTGSWKPWHMLTGTAVSE
jgi:hypothetical protein